VAKRVDQKTGNIAESIFITNNTKKLYSKLTMIKKNKNAPNPDLIANFRCKNTSKKIINKKYRAEKTITLPLYKSIKTPTEKL